MVQVHLFEHAADGLVTEDAPTGMGHEASGIIHSVGPSVTKVRVGDRVAIEPGLPCRRCKQCKSGRYNICRNMVFPAAPPRAPGTLVRLFRIPEDFVHRIPESLSLQEAVMAEPLGVAVHAVRMAQLRPGQTVLVLGSGTVGMLAAAVARAFGVRSIFITDINKDKLALATSFVDGCATFAPRIDSTPQAEAERFRKEFGIPDGVDAVLECTGVQSSAQMGVYCLEPGGIFVQVGMGRPEQTLPILYMCQKEITLKPCFRYGAGDYDAALDMLCSGTLVVKSLVSSTVPFEKAEEAWEKTRRGEGVKNLIQGIQD